MRRVNVPRVEPPVTNRRIGSSAHFTAWAWNVLGFPYADAFATPLGRGLYAGNRALAWMTGGRRAPRRHPLTALEFRHRLIEAAVMRHDPDCIAELGAGLSRRPITFALDHGIPALEFDQPHMVAAKRRALSRAGLHRPGTPHRLIATDVASPGFAAQLCRELQGFDRPMIVAEGLTLYLDPTGLHRMFTAIGQALAGTDGALLFTTRFDQPDDHRLGRRIRRALVRRLIRPNSIQPFKSWATLQTALTEAGLTTATLLDPTDYERDDPRLSALTSHIAVVLALPRATAA